MENGPPNDTSPQVSVVFFGGLTEALVEIHSHLAVLAVVSQEGKCSPAIDDFCKAEGLVRVEISSLDELESIATEWGAAIAISAGFGLIFKQRHLAWFSRVINFHPGCIFQNRGRHPLPNAIWHGHKTMAVSAHEVVDEEIDAGRLISRIEFVIDYRTDYQSNLLRLLAGLRYLVKDLCLLIDRHAELPSWDMSGEAGRYYPPMSSEQIEQVVSADSLILWRR